MQRKHGRRVVRQNTKGGNSIQNFVAEFLEARAYLSTTVVFPTNPPEYAIASGPTNAYPAIADFNGDGIPDIAIANDSLEGQDGTISVLLGTGDGKYGSVETLPTGERPYQVIAGVFTSSGNEDLVVTNAEDGTVGFYAGLGNGQFAAPVLSSYGPSNNIAGDIVHIAAADLTGNGILDLIITGAINTNANPEDQMVIMMGNGQGTFTVSQTIPGEFDTAVTGEFLGDGLPDVATVGSNSNVIDIFGNEGNGTLSTTPVQLNTNAPGGSQGAGLVTGDFNGDGKPDLALLTASETSNTAPLTVFLNEGGGNFSAPITTNLQLADDLAVGDFNDDGNLDVVTTNGTNLDVYLGNGDGTFQTTPAFALNNFDTSGGPAVAELTSSGLPDVVIDGGNSDTVLGNGISVLLDGQSGGGGGGGGGGGATLTPTIAGKLPSSVIAGQKAPINETVTITDSGAAYDDPATTQLFLSTSDTIDSSSIALPATISKTLKLKVGARTSFKLSLKSLPSSVPNGVYHVIAQVTDHDGNTSVAASTGTITVAPKEIDLSVTLVKSVSTTTGGKKFTDTIRVANAGNTAAVGSLPILVDTSPDGLLDDATTLASSSKGINIKPASSITIPLSLTAPPSGTSAFLIFDIDASNKFQETNLANNIVVTPSKVTFS